MRFFKVKITKALLLSFSKRNRALLVKACHFLNELNILAKIVQFASNWSEDGILRRAEIVQTFHLSLLLAGKLHEANNLRHEQLGDNACEPCKTHLPEVARIAHDKIRTYFADPDNIISVLRNSYAFHPPTRSTINQQIQKLHRSDELCMYLTEAQGNSLYAFSYDLVSRGVFDHARQKIAIEDGVPVRDVPIARCMRRVVSDILNAYGWFQTLFNNAVACILKSNLGACQRSMDEEELTGLPAIEEITLPFFVSAPNAR